MNPKTKKIVKYGCLGISGMCLLLLISLPILFKQAFGPIKERIEIKQEIGGKLICYSEYNADLASWFYDIDYEYVSEKGDSITIGSGEYYGQEWNKNEQIHKIGEWMILKTGGEYGADKLLIGKDKISDWATFKISPREIEKDSLWKTEEIFVKQSWLPQESFIKYFKGKRIIVEYQYRIGEAVSDQEIRIITYEFDENDGIPKMKNVTLKER